MNIVTEINEWQALRQSLINKKIGFVPTMGHLHAGHLSLCERAKRENDVTVVSIFVNPAQFNVTADFEKYPKTLADDKALLAPLNVDYLLAPSAHDIYADNYEIKITETEISKTLEGEYRPGHFDGMLTVVLKLLNLIQPQKAYFGEKDYQQLLLVKKMVTSLFLPIDIIGCETIRADNGLALSSRNSRLNTTQKALAPHLSQLLKSKLSNREVIQQLETLGFKVDYVAEEWNRRLAAVWLDDIRLIDNVALTEE